MKKIKMVGLSLLLSAFAFAATQLTKLNIQGDYFIKSKDFYMVAYVTLKENKVAHMNLSNLQGEIHCDGTYSFDEETQELNTAFNDCESNSTKLSISVAHTINLKDQSVESLTNTATVNVTVKISEDTIGPVPFTVQKLK